MIKVVTHVDDMLAGLVGQLRYPKVRVMVAETAQYIPTIRLVLSVLAEEVEIPCRTVLVSGGRCGRASGSRRFGGCDGDPPA